MHIVEPKDRTHLIVLGAGGTGSWLASFLSKLDLQYVTLIDGDAVEVKNITRQNFTVADVKANKAQAIATRYDFDFVPNYVNTKDDLLTLVDEHTGAYPVFVGCLDNNFSRQLVHHAMNELPNATWLDAGNAERHGQTYVMIKEDGKVVEDFQSPIEIDKALQDTTGMNNHPEQLSCADLQENTPQNVTANITSATLLFDLINITVSGGVFLNNCYVFDTNTVSILPPKQSALERRVVQ